MPIVIVDARHSRSRPLRPVLMFWPQQCGSTSVPRHSADPRRLRRPCAVWFYYSKSLNCCIEIRGMLDDGSGTVCPPMLFTAPCREFTGNW